MKIEVIGWNYEGAHFRGIPSVTDEVLLRIVLVGTEKQICRTVTREFSYDNEVDTLRDLLQGYANDMIPNGDGCGGVYMIMDAETGEILWENEFYDEEVRQETPLDLGEVEASLVSLNRLVRRKLQTT